MLFHTTQFLHFFLVVFAVYWALPRDRWRVHWLLAASAYFYMSWNPWLISLILCSASVDYCAALALARGGPPARRRLLLGISLAVNLGLLAFFKYANFFLDSAQATLGFCGLPSQRRALEIILPLGISFYTFETISYIVDVYRGKIAPVRSYADYALYILFFPHLIAGPIVRPREFLPQIRRRKRLRWDRVQVGVQFFLLGLFKKAVIADRMAAVVDPVFADPAAHGTAATWLAVLAYSAQIYCDFSGYSDMAVGTAHLFGYRLPANFALPYFAASVIEFWKKWHVSLSTWLRDYVYIPLGGGRRGAARKYANLLLTMTLGGLWHGASWTFAAWGLYHGVLLVLCHAAAAPAWLSRPVFRPLAVAATFLAVSVGWVFFRAQSFADAGTVLGRLFTPVRDMALSPAAPAAVGLLLALLLGHFAKAFVPIPRLERRLPAPVLGACLALLLTAALVLMPETGAGFIYFRF